jgi:hypothetical protein
MVVPAVRGLVNRLSYVALPCFSARDLVHEPVLDSCCLVCHSLMSVGRGCAHCAREGAVRRGGAELR